MGWNLACSSQLSLSQMESSHFWTSSSGGTQMASSRRLCTGKPPTWTATSTLCPLELRVSFSPNTTLKQLLTRAKNQILTEELTGVVYQVPCASCPASYVGQTGRCLGKRMKKYRKAVESGDCANLALAERAWSHHYPVDWDKVRVLEQQPRLYHRLALEAIHIKSHPHLKQRWWHIVPNL